MNAPKRPTADGFHRLHGLLSGALVLCAGVFSFQCTPTDGTSSWEYDASRATDGESDTEATDGESDTEATETGDVEPDAESCDRFWNPAGGFAEDADCDSDEFRYVDRICSPSPRAEGSGRQCNRSGNGRCYQKCETDADCTNPERPHCSVLGLFAAGDYDCNDSVKICRSTCRDDCPTHQACASRHHAAGASRSVQGAADPTGRPSALTTATFTKPPPPRGAVPTRCWAVV